MLDPLKRSAASAGSEVGWRPENAAPIASGDIAALKPEQPRRCALERVDHGRNGMLWWILDKQMDMIVLAIAGDKNAIHCGADLAKVAF